MSHYPPPTVIVAKNSSATAGMVLGILALLFSWIPFVGVIAWPLAILGVILGAVGLRNARRGAPGKGSAIAGLVTSAVALVICVAYVAVTAAATATVPLVAASSAPTAPAALASLPTTQAAPAPAAAPPSSAAAPVRTVGQFNAMNKAMDYIAYSAFSRKGLIKQLEFDGFTTADATYAVDNIVVNWTMQAEAKAKDYMNYSSFSRSGLIRQLTFDGFTPDQAKQGATSVGL